MLEEAYSPQVLAFQAKTRYSAIARERWDLLADAIQLAQEQCELDGQDVDCHFRYLSGQPGIEDWYLSRYACLLINDAIEALSKES